MTIRRSLLLKANQVSMQVRDSVGCDEIAPVDVYASAAALGLNVLFVNISMEGIFFKKPLPSRIMLSSLRPLARRNFTCAHEIGHFAFGHGSTIDELEAKDRADPTQPDEILANGFAGFFMMPPLGIRNAFARRGLTAEQATPLQILTVATEYGVGYETLVYHMGGLLKDLSIARQTELLRSSPKSIRDALIGASDAVAMSVIDAHCSNCAIDLEIGHVLTLPPGTTVTGNAVAHLGDFSDFRLFKASKRGTAVATFGGRTISLRTAPFEFAGRAIFRHMEDPDD